MMNINEVLSHASVQLKKANIASAALDARLLLSHLLNKSHEYLLLNLDEVLTTDELEKFLKLVDKRKEHKPIAYILGYKEFYGRTFMLNDRVLIPRPDTETLVDAVLSQLAIPNPHILEIGCGSGCIIVSLLLEVFESSGVACDISSSALDCTIANALKHNVDSRLEVIKSNWFNNIREEKFDIIVCNPPYISEGETHLMSRETILHEPHIALFAGDGGFADYKIIASNAAKFLKSNGELFLEIGFNQLEAVKQIFVNHKFIFENSYNDINKHNRVIKFRTM
jgi:release factor glutamine methyltransferase